MKALVVACLFAATAAHAQSSLPDPALTPGAINAEVTPETIHQTICVRGWTRTIRPAEELTRGMKRQSIAAYGYTDSDLRDFQYDHLVPLEVGGAPTDPRNMWPQPIIGPDGWRADDKDLLEHKLNHLVCSGRLSLTQAQAAIARNWEDAYTMYVTDGE